MGKKKKGNEQILRIYVTNDTIHQMLESTLMNLEIVEDKLAGCADKNNDPPYEVLMVHDILLSDLNILLHYRAHEGNDYFK